jgi:hypothetical protein
MTSLLISYGGKNQYLGAFAIAQEAEAALAYDREGRCAASRHEGRGDLDLDLVSWGWT